MSFLLEKKQEHEGKCEAAIRAEQYGDAVFHAAKAAEFAYALASQCEGHIAGRYIEDAEGWLEIAERLKKEPPKKTRGAGKGSGPITDEKGDAPDEDWLVTAKPNITFDMIAGMEQAKLSIREMVVYPLRQPEKARSLGLKPGGGVLLFGPPGNGKTMLGKAIANELDAAFYYASGAQIRSKWHGESEQRLRKLIQAARNNPVAVLFLDEVEGLLPKRGGNSVVDNRIVTQFLAEIGGFEESENILLLLGATNLPWDIDPAVFRTGRFDAKIFIGLPDMPARLGILRMHLHDVQCEEGLTPEQWAARFDGYTGSDIVGIINAAKRACLSRSVKENLEPVLRGADLESAFKTIPSSVTPKLMQKYEAFQEARF
ncbi:MAG: ATP-binding protein [Kiritimatiellae bacterium]|nr:ATP-binding protein [Kiritimatiellia bacterium]